MRLIDADNLREGWPEWKWRRQAMGNGKLCANCGRELEGRQQKYCAGCAGPAYRKQQAELTRRRREAQKQKAAGGAPEPKERQKRTLKPPGGPLAGMTLDEAAALARRYRPPYCSYGRLTGYIRAHGTLPPASYLRE